jgi:hypothetical protein
MKQSAVVPSVCLVCTLLLQLFAPNVLGGGTINFNNRVLVAGIDAPVFGVDGVTRLSGDNYRAKLYAGLDPANLEPSSLTSQFRTGDGAGYMLSPGAVYFHNIVGGAKCYVQMRVYDANMGWSYETASAAKGSVGASKIIQVIAGNPDGSPPTVPADLVGLESFQVSAGPFEVQVSPSQQFAFAGQTVRLEGRLQGIAAPTYQWQHEGIDLPGAKSLTLDLPQVTAAGAGTYTLIAKMGETTTSAASAELRVFSPPTQASIWFQNRLPQFGIDAPVLTTDGSSRLAGEGFVAQLYVGSTRSQLIPQGKPAPFGTGENAGYWIESDEFWRALPDQAPGSTVYVQVRVWETAAGTSYESAGANGGMVGASGILTVTLGGPGTSNPYPTLLSQLSSFRVDKLPKILSQPPSFVHARVGTDLDVSVVVSPSLTPVTCQWYRDGQPVPFLVNLRLIVADIRLDEAGVYTLEVRNAAGTVRSDEIRVVVSPFGAATGLISFTNWKTNVGVSALITDAKGNLVRGYGYRAQLYVSNLVNNSLLAVGDPLEFDTQQPGAFGSEKENIVGIPWVAPGQKAMVQVRAWESPQGESYDVAATNNLQHGASDFFEVEVGGFAQPPIPPAELTGLKSFSLVQENRLKVITPEIHAAAGSDAILLVEAQGPRVLGCTWYFGDQELKSTPSPKLFLTQLRVDQSGTYRVAVTNELGTLLSGPIQLTVSELTSGGTVIFANRLTVVGLDAPVYDIDGATRLLGANYLAQLYSGTSESSLAPVEDVAWFSAAAGYWNSANRVRSLPNVAPGATAYLQIRVWDSAIAPTYDQTIALNGKAGSSLVFTAVTGGAGSPPGVPTELLNLKSFRLEQGAVFTQQPDDVDLFPGQELVLTAQVTSASPVSFQWTHNGTAIERGTNATLALPAITPEAAGDYQVVASNGVRPIASQVAKVRVAPSVPAEGSVVFKNRVPEAGLDAPVFLGMGTYRLQGDVKREDYVAQLYAGTDPLTLKAVGDPAPFGTGDDAGYWLPGDQFWRSIPGMAPGTKALLQIRVWDRKIAADFETAEASISKIGISELMEVELGGPGAASPFPVVMTNLTSFHVGILPVITQQPAGGRYQVGQTAVLQVKAQGPANLRYAWYKDGKHLATTSSDSRTWTLGSTNEAGNYSVRVISPEGERISAIAALEVVAPSPGGTILFANNLPEQGIVAPVFGQDSVTPLEGTNYLAQLMVGLTQWSMLPIGQPVSFGVGTNAGFLDWQGISPTVTFSNIAPDIMVYVGMVAWHRAYGETPSEAAMVGGLIGTSSTLTLRTGGLGSSPSEPTPLKGLQSFRLKMKPYLLGYTGDILVLEGEPVTLEVFPAEGLSGFRQWFVAPTAMGPWTQIDSAHTWSLSLGTLTAGSSTAYMFTLSTADGITSTPPMQVYVGANIRANEEGWKNLKLPISTEAGPVYSVERSTNLLAWSPIGTLTNETGTIDLTDPGASNYASAFYRVRSDASGQLVSRKTVGFVTWEIPYGYSMRAMPLLNGRNTVGELLNALPPEVMAYKYHPGTGFSIIMLGDGWGDPTETILPGEGLIVRNGSPNTYRLSLVGEVPEGERSRQLPAGWSIQSALFPQAGRVDTDLGMPLLKGNNVDLLDTYNYEYRPYVYEGDGKWDSNGIPQVSIGEAFWLWRTSAGVWTNTYNPAP